MFGLDTREIILASARKMAQAHGYSGLNFRTLAADVGIKSASIHYHFPTKADLGAALAKRYTEDAREYLDGRAVELPDAMKCLRKYTDMFRIALQNGNRMCLCGYLAAEYDDLPDPVKAEVRGFADMNIEWLASVLTRLAPSTTLPDVERRATAIYAAVSGAQLAARSRADISIYDGLVETYRQVGLIPCESAFPPHMS